MSEDNKSLFFIVLSLGCVWLILDNVYGNKYLTLALSKLFDFVDSPTTSNTDYKIGNGLYDKLTEDMDEDQKKKFDEIIEYKTGKEKKEKSDKSDWTITF